MGNRAEYTPTAGGRLLAGDARHALARVADERRHTVETVHELAVGQRQEEREHDAQVDDEEQIGRASCRERVSSPV